MGESVKEINRASNAEARQIRLLLVDDDRLILGTLSSELRSQGYFVEVASNAAAALAAAESLPIDLALLDVRMPGMSGIELGRKLLAERQVPFIFLSAFDDRATVERGIAEGALGYVVKPVDVVQLVPTITAALARARELKVLSDLKEQLEAALQGDRNINVAVGILMERLSLPRDEAFRRLRTSARNQGKTLETIAATIVNASEEIGALG